MRSSHTLGQLDTCFDDSHAIANAAWLLAASLVHNLLRSRRRHRVERPRRAGGGQDPAPHPAGPARPHHPLRPATAAAPARRLAWAAWFDLALARLRCVAYAT
jgi:hypothetical protein